MSADEFLARLEGIRESGRRRWMARCPSHADARASLSVRELECGRVLIHCFAGCDAQEIVGAVGAELRDLFPPSRDAAIRAKRTRPTMSEMIAALEMDLARVAVCAAQLSRGEALSPEARTRLRESSTRITQGLDECRSR